MRTPPLPREARTVVVPMRTPPLPREARTVVVPEESLPLILPAWITEKRDMICPSGSVRKHKLLGSGQYGHVHKGAFHHGNAV